MEKQPHLLGCTVSGFPDTFQAKNAWTSNISPMPQL